jgi:DNA-binding NtrC family response regulator
LAASLRADTIDDERQRLEHIIATAAGKNRVTAESARRDLLASAHGPAARTCIEQLERIGRLNGPLVLKCELGIQPLGWAAVAHLSSPRADGPLIVVDGTSSSEHELTRWASGENTPLALADGGSLVVSDVSALPPEVQELIAQSLSRSVPSRNDFSVFPASLIAVLYRAPDELVERGNLSKTLRRWLGDTNVIIPPLRERAEDLRSLVLSRLTSIGLRLRGEPMGVEPAALRLLTEHTWPGNEHELDAVLTLAARKSSGVALTARDLALIGFRPDIAAPPALTPLPGPSRRRRRRPH